MGIISYSVLGARHTTCVFLIWQALARESVIARLSHTGLLTFEFDQPYKLWAKC